MLGTNPVPGKSLVFWSGHFIYGWPKLLGNAVSPKPKYAYLQLIHLKPSYLCWSLRNMLPSTPQWYSQLDI